VAPPTPKGPEDGRAECDFFVCLAFVSASIEGPRWANAGVKNLILRRPKAMKEAMDIGLAQVHRREHWISSLNAGNALFVRRAVGGLCRLPVYVES